jgi:short/branched chain acyl-CoA dehydrogenase
MDFELTEDQKAIQSLCREFARDEVAPRAEEYDAKSEFPYDLVRKMGELGLMGLVFPEEWGGAGADTVSYALAVMEIARADASTAITLAAAVSLGSTPFYLFGTKEQKEKYLVPLAQGTMLWGFGLTEPQAGSDAGATLTRGELRDGKWVINGTKAFITNSGTDMTGGTTITAVTGPGGDGRKEISTLIVPQDTPGFSRSRKYKKMGWRASDTRELSFENAAVPEENLLGERGRGLHQFLTILDGGRISVAALSVGLAMGAYDEAYKYAKDRRQFGQPISKFQAVQFKLADIATELEAARWLTYRAAHLRDTGQPFHKEAAMAKLKASRVATWAASEAVQIHGGLGYMLDTPVARFYCDSKVLEIGEGTNEIQHLVIARALGC